MILAPKAANRAAFSGYLTGRITSAPESRSKFVRAPPIWPVGVVTTTFMFPAPPARIITRSGPRQPWAFRKKESAQRIGVDPSTLAHWERGEPGVRDCAPHNAVILYAESAVLLSIVFIA